MSGLQSRSRGHDGYEDIGGVIGIFRAEAHARAIVEPNAAPVGLFPWDVERLASPDPFDPLVIDDPARSASKQRLNVPIAISAILAGKHDDVGAYINPGYR